MSGTTANKKSLNSGRELLYRSIDKLNEFGHGEVGGNVSKYPTVVVFMGSKSSEYFNQVKQPLDDNWNNAMHLEYLNVYLKGDDFVCRKLIRDEDDPSVAEWSEELDSFEEALNEAVVTMLGKGEKVFSDTSSMKFDFILDATEETGFELYNLYRDIKCHINLTKFKSLYLMIDQNPSYVKLSDKLLQYVLHDEKLNSPNVYIISNQQKNKTMLLADRIWKNYRLIANLIILGGNKNFSGTNHALTIGFKTVSYAIVPKPTDEIGEVSIDALLNKMYEMEQKRFSSVQPWTIQRFKERIGMGVDNSIASANDLLNRLMSNSSNFRAEAVLYLPYSTDRDLDDLQRERSYGLKVIDSRCFGAASAYINCVCKKPVIDYFEKDDRREAIREELRKFILSCFNFFELQQLKDIRGEILDCIIQPTIVKAAMPSDIVSAFDIQAKRETNMLFYTLYKEILAEVMKDIFNKIDAFDEIYSLIRREMKNERIGNGDEDPSIEKYYQTIVGEYITDKENYSSGLAFPKVFNPDLNKQELLDAIYDEYCEMVRDRRVYALDFEKEIKERSERLSDIEQQTFVKSELINQIEGSMRLNNIIEFQEMKLVTYYLINNKADYAARLKGDSGYSNGDYLLFNLNRTDCIEQLEIYSIPNTSLIHLLDNEEDGV